MANYTEYSQFDFLKNILLNTHNAVLISEDINSKNQYNIFTRIQL